MRRLGLVLLLVAVSAACGSPPEKEYHQAVGAIEAARAAGAALYAPDELAAAETSLTQYDQAVAQRDFRQALSHALSSRESATAAAAKAAGEKARMRGETERLFPVIQAELSRARAAAAPAARPQPQTARMLRTLIADTEKALQEARAALERDEVKKARELVDGLETRLAQALAPLGNAGDAPGSRRR
jgi:hypothetical protein